jgi:type VII secretion protein EccB
MATKKDLVEAYSFSRRRLVTAFVSGAPGGREVEPARPGRTIVGGVALAVLLAAGAAIAGVFSPRTPDDWTDSGLILSKETGAAYVIVPSDDEDESADVVLRPVINSTSAKLILGADSEPMFVPQDTIDAQHIGEDIGILGAPASLPTSSLLIDSGWTACTADGRGVSARISADPDVTVAPSYGITVESGGDLYVLAQPADVGPGTEGAYLYSVPPQRSSKADETDNLLEALHLGITSEAITVPRQWLTLFPSGGELDWSSFGIGGFGQKPDAELPGDAAGAVVGDLLVTDDGKELIVTDSGPVALDPFSAAVYEHVLTPRGRVPHQVPVDTEPSVGRGDPLLGEAHWPDAALQELPESPCAQLAAEHGEAPLVELGYAGESSAVSPGVPADRTTQEVDPGRGAYVLSGSWADRASGSPFVIDSKGRANPLVGSTTADLLGYGEHPVVVVPDTWVKLFGCGVDLSPDAALLPPTEPDGNDDRCEA